LAAFRNSVVGLFTYLALRGAGEERLLDAAVRGRIPLTVATIDIAKTESPEMQRELLKPIKEIVTLL